MSATVRRLRLFAFLILAVWPVAAAAGAWTQEKGRGLVIATVSGSNADRRLERGGGNASVPRFRKAEIHLLAEYGVTDRFTARVKGTGENWQVDGEGGSAHRGWGTQEIGGRFRFHRSENFIASAEASLLLDEAPGDDGVSAGAEARLLLGAPFVVGGRHGFVDGQAAYRYRPRFETDEVRIDLTGGYRPLERVLVLVQSFSKVAVRPSEDGAPLYDQHKLGAGVVLDVTERWSVQLGAATTLFGSAVLDEDEVSFSVWRRF